MRECPMADSGPLLVSGISRPQPSPSLADTPLQISHIYTLPRLFTETMTSAVSPLLSFFYNPVLILYGSLDRAEDDAR